MKGRNISAFLATVAMMFVTGCATESFDADKAPEYMVVVAYTPFFQFGPQQPRGPDLSLKAGTRFKLLRRESGYSYVQLDDGQSGYLANEAIAPAPPKPREPDAVSSVPAPGKKSGSRQKDRDSAGPAYSGPAVNDTPLPDRNAPPPDLNIDPEVVPDTVPSPSAAPSGTPKFRY